MHSVIQKIIKFLFATTAENAEVYHKMPAVWTVWHTHTSLYFCEWLSKMPHFRVWWTGGVAYDPQIRVWARFCTMDLATKFHHPKFNSSKVIIMTNNKQMPLKTPTSLCNATPVGT